jgi:hypothetical protein
MKQNSDIREMASLHDYDYLVTQLNADERHAPIIEVVGVEESHDLLILHVRRDDRCCFPEPIRTSIYLGAGVLDLFGQRAWNELQATPSHLEQQARAFVRECEHVGIASEKE